LDAAEEHFRASLAADPANADAYAGLGEVARERGDLDLAESWLTEATNRGSKRPETRVLLADVLLARLRALGDPERASRLPDWKRARGLLERALEADPDFGEAHALLGATFFYDPIGAGAGIPSLERAMALLPDRADVVFNLVMLHVLAGRFTAARSLFEHQLKQRDQGDLLADAREAVERGELTAAANEASARGESERALELLRRAAALTRDPSLRRDMESQLDTFAATSAYNQQVERFNQAIDQANRGEVEAALGALRDLLAELPEGELADRVRRLVRELGGRGR
jgi:tetratricopeptide (TPR) repeat protein